MKNFTIAIVASLSFSIVSGQTKDMEEIKKINLEWLNSYPKKDTAALSKIFADDIVVINATGTAFKKNEVLTRIMELNRQYISVNLDSLLEARVIGNTAIIIGKSTFVRKLDGVQSTMKNSYMIVFEKRKGKWQIVASHSTLLNAN